MPVILLHETTIASQHCILKACPLENYINIISMFLGSPYSIHIPHYLCHVTTLAFSTFNLRLGKRIYLKKKLAQNLTKYFVVSSDIILSSYVPKVSLPAMCSLSYAF